MIDPREPRGPAPTPGPDASPGAGASLAFPAAEAEATGWRPREVRVAGARGRAYGPLAPALVELLERWAAAGAPPAELVSLKGERVLAAGELVFKRYRRPSLLGRLLRGGRARRAAETSLRLRPVPAPRPLLALAGFGPAREGLLVAELVRGGLMREVWYEDAAARRALPQLLATLHGRRILHGDLHPRNLAWGGDGWVVLDVDAVRHPLHRLRTERLVLGQWARLLVYLGDEEGLREAFEEYVGLDGALFHDARAWERVVAEARRMLLARDRPPPRPSRHLLSPPGAPPRE